MLTATPYCQRGDLLGGEEIAAQAARRLHALHGEGHLAGIESST